MAAKKKKKKVKKSAKAVKAKRTPARKTKAKKAAKRPAKKAAKASSKKKVVKATKKAPAKKSAKKPVKKKQTVGEGDYAASRKFDKDQSAFVAKNKANIPAMGQEAEKALDGPQGDILRDAEAAAAGRSRDTF